MSVLKKIRENVGLVIAVIALCLVVFIVQSVISNNMGPGQDSTVGEVCGESIDYGALNNKFEVAQRGNPNATTTAEQYQMKDQAWNTLVREIFFGKEWEEAGIGVSDEEVMMIFLGQIYDPYVINSGFFSDSTGRYNPGVVQQVLAQVEEMDLNNPNLPDMYRNYKLGLLDLRNTATTNRMSAKWQSAIRGSALVSDNELKYSYEEASRTADISYLYVPYGTIPDEQVQVTDADRDEYYNKHREAYKRYDDEVKVKYAFFNIIPSRQDSADTRTDLLKLIPEFAASTEPFQFANTSSDKAIVDTLPKPLGELPPALVAINGRTDTVVGPLLGPNGFEIMRVVKASTDSVNANVKIRHILVTLKGNTPADSLAAKAKADSLRNVVAADKSKFAEIVASSSDDQSTKAVAGEIGWIKEDRLGTLFDKAIKAGKVGDVVVAPSESGYHVVDIEDRSNRMYSFASITRIVNAGNETNDSIFKAASSYHGEVISGGDMDQAISKFPQGKLLESSIIGPGTYTLMGIDAARPVVCWAFKSEEGQVCDKLIETEGAFVVGKVMYKGERGYGSVESLKNNMEFEFAVRNWVKAKQIKGKLTGSDLASMASSYGVGATTGQAMGLRMASSDVQGVGNEPKVVGRAFGLQPGATSKPLAGNSGVFVVRLDKINEPAPMDELNKMIQQQTLRSSKIEKTVTALFMGMRELADIRDQRYKADF